MEYFRILQMFRPVLPDFRERNSFAALSHRFDDNRKLSHEIAPFPCDLRFVTHRRGKNP